MNKRGVTLIELIVVMVIIGIGAVLFVPNMRAWLSNYRLRSATRDIASIMRTAQMKAVSNNLAYRVRFTLQNGTDPAKYILEYAPGWLPDGVEQDLSSEILITGLTFVGNNNIAQFNANGTASSGSITLENSMGTSRQISVTSSTGRVRIN